MISVLMVPITGLFCQLGHENQNKQAVINSVNAQFEDLRDLSDWIWSYEEIAFEEIRSAADLVSYAESNGFRVTKGIGEMPTAFVAE